MLVSNRVACVSKHSQNKNRAEMAILQCQAAGRKHERGWHGRVFAHTLRAQNDHKRGLGKIEKRTREVPETSIKQVQQWFVAETGKNVCRKTTRKCMKMSAKPFIKTRAHFLSDVHRVRRLSWCSGMKRRIVVPAAAGGWIFSWDLSRVSARDVKDVSRISAKTVSRFARLTLSPTYKHNT